MVAEQLSCTCANLVGAIAHESPAPRLGTPPGGDAQPLHLPVGPVVPTRDTLPQQAPHRLGFPFAFLLTPARVLGRLARQFHRRGPAPMGGSMGSHFAPLVDGILPSRV